MNKFIHLEMFFFFRFMESQTSVKNPYFVFSFLWKLSHDLTYQIERLDKILSEWFKKIHGKNLLRNTLLFVTSDHGNRFDDIRQDFRQDYKQIGQVFTDRH